ncbi:MAG: hypothetical protein K8F27_07265 [Sulfuricellaceae bacterium]|nr:hypothetical protein [Sulfuricellaceae bacterium]
MLDTLSSALFAVREGKTLTVEAAEQELALEIFSVKENPLAAGFNAKRTPFNVMLRGPDSPCLADGCYALRADGDEAWRLESVYLNRIIPPASSDGRGAFYQAVFG